MCGLHIGDTVRLSGATPRPWHWRDDLGIVQNLWISPTLTCEIEFFQGNQRSGVRVLLSADDVEVIEPPRLLN
jgi:hypothetical protein